MSAALCSPAWIGLYVGSRSRRRGSGVLHPAPAYIGGKRRGGRPSAFGAPPYRMRWWLGGRGDSSRSGEFSMTGKLGFRILPSPPRLSRDLVERFRGLASTNLADAMGRFAFMDPGIQARSGLTLCGLAVTVNCRPADNLMVHKALQVAEPGDVVVVSTCGNVTSAVFGELMCHTAVAARLGGIVVDGAIRDVEGIARLGRAAFRPGGGPGRRGA